MECLHTTGFHRRLRTSGVPTLRRWWWWAKISYRLQLRNVGGWSAWWPFCQACIGRIGISASVYFTLCGSLELMYSVQNSAARDASRQLKLLQRHTSLRPSHFLYVTDDAEGRPLPSTPLTPIWSSQSHYTSPALAGHRNHICNVHGHNPSVDIYLILCFGSTGSR